MLPGVHGGRRRGRAARAPCHAPLGKLCESLAEPRPRPARRGAEMCSERGVMGDPSDGGRQGGVHTNTGAYLGITTRAARILLPCPPRPLLPPIPTTQRPGKQNATMLFSCLRTSSRP